MERFEEYKLRQTIYDNHHDRVYRQWVFLQTVKIGLFTVFAAANGTLLNWYSIALPQLKVVRVHTVLGAYSRDTISIVTIDPRGAIWVCLVGVATSIVVLWTQSVLEDLIRGRVTRGRLLENQLGIHNGFFAEIEQRMHFRPSVVTNVPVIMGAVVGLVFLVWLLLAYWAFLYLP
jgi:hypothetical protein